MELTRDIILEHWNNEAQALDNDPTLQMYVEEMKDIFGKISKR